VPILQHGGGVEEKKKKVKKTKRNYRTSQNIRIINVFLESLLSESFPLLGVTVHLTSLRCTPTMCWSLDLPWVYMYVCIFSHTFYCCYKPLPLCWGLAVLWSSPFLFLFSFFFQFCSFLFFIILIFKPMIIFLHLFLCLLFLLFFSPCSYSLMYINLLHFPLFKIAYLLFLSFLSSQYIY